jgi:hypothetical protein
VTPKQTLGRIALLAPVSIVFAAIAVMLLVTRAPALVVATAVSILAAPFVGVWPFLSGYPVRSRVWLGCAALLVMVVTAIGWNAVASGASGFASLIVVLPLVEILGGGIRAAMGSDVRRSTLLALWVAALLGVAATARMFYVAAMTGAEAGPSLVWVAALASGVWTGIAAAGFIVLKQTGATTEQGGAA